jgi:integrase
LRERAKRKELKVAKKRGNSEGSIYQRKDGRWVGSVNLGFVNGKRRRKDFYGDTRREVQAQLTKALADVQNGLPIVQETQTVRQYLERWLADVVARKTRPKTHQSYEEVVRLYIAPFVGELKLVKLNTQQVRAMLNALEDNPDLSSRTVQYTHAILRKALNDALKDQTIVRNVAALVDPPRVVAKEVQPLTPSEARVFLEAIQGDRDEALYTVAVSLGLRQGESLGVRWPDVDLEAGTLRVRYALQRLKPKGKGREVRGLEIHLVEQKNKKARRTLELPAVTLAALVMHRARQAEERVLCGSKWKVSKVHCEGKTIVVDDFVFTTKIGTPLDGRLVTKRFQRILKHAGIPRHRFHDARHTAATLLAVQGVHPKAIQSVLGWDQLAMVDRYTHFVDEMRKDAAVKMDAILKPVAVNLAVKPEIKKAN